MVLSFEDRAVIKNDWEEKGWTAYNIVKQHPQKNWKLCTVQRLLAKLKTTGTTDRKPGSGRPITASTDENVAAVEDLILSQEDAPSSHVPPRKIAKGLGISRSTVLRIRKKIQLNVSKRLKSTKVSNAARLRRQERSQKLAQRFSKDKRACERLVFQDEKDFPLQVPVNTQNNRVYHRGLKKDIPPAHLFAESNRQSLKLMVSAGLTWHGVTKPFFVNEEGLKVNGPRYLAHLQQDLLPAIREVYPRENFIFVQDSAPAHASNVVKNYMKAELGKRFITPTDWPSYSPDCNPLDYYFWNDVSTKVYEGRHCQPFATLDEMKTKIEEVWDQCASNLTTIRKSIRQFVPRLEAVVDKEGRSIKTVFR
jgi:transposase